MRFTYEQAYAIAEKYPGFMVAFHDDKQCTSGHIVCGNGEVDVMEFPRTVPTQITTEKHILAQAVENLMRSHT